MSRPSLIVRLDAGITFPVVANSSALVFNALSCPRVRAARRPWTEVLNHFTVSFRRITRILGPLQVARESGYFRFPQVQVFT